MELATIIETLLHGNQLKRTARTGWVQRGVLISEDVAAHSYGVAFATLILAQLIDEPVDLGKALALAVLHDLPEGLTSDIPAPAWRYLPAGSKVEAERSALKEILGESSFKDKLMDWWEELPLAESAEARLVHDADKIDLYVQAAIYEEQTGNSHLHSFWDVAQRFHFAQAQDIYDALRDRHETHL